MSTVTDNGFLTLAQWAALQDPNGNITQVANILAKLHPLLDKMTWLEGNLPTGHQIAQSVTALPSPTWRSFNVGVTATSADIAQYMEACGILEDWSKIDCALAELGGAGNAMQVRARQDDLKLEGMKQALSTAIFYESATTNPARVHGLTARFPGTSGYTASSYTLAGTNAGVNCHSAWLLTLAPGKIYGVYPKGSKMGLQRNDLGKQVVTDSNGKSLLAYMTQIVWNCGLAVEDYRYGVRSQWDPDDAAMADNELGLVLLLQNAAETVFTRTADTVWVMNRTTKKKLRAQLTSNDMNNLSQVVLPGRGPVDHFDGIPIIVDDMLVAETAIS